MQSVVPTRVLFGVIVVVVACLAPPAPAQEPSGTGGLPSGNGDVNASGDIDISDAVHLLGWLFLGSEGPAEIVCPPPGGGPLPSTGQTNCYDDYTALDAPCISEAFPGQDGYYDASCPSYLRFVDNGDGTVTDHCTGLVWQQDTADTNGDGVIGDDDRLDWGDALRYCRDLDFAGHTDWRLPNSKELQSIVDYGRVRPAIDPVFSAVPKDRYKASTTSVRNPLGAGWVFSGDGHCGGGRLKAERDFVRAVRTWKDTSVYRVGQVLEPGAATRNGDVNGSGLIDLSDAIALLNWLFAESGPPVPMACPPRGGGALPVTGQTTCYDDAGAEIPCGDTEFPGQDAEFVTAGAPEPRFVDNADGTVTDRATGLTWLQDTADINEDGSIGDEDLVNWEDALIYCARLEFAGHADWRLPNVRELFSIVDHGRFDPAIDPIFSVVDDETFPAECYRCVLYWTSTTHLRTPDDAWAICFIDGIITDNQKRISPVDQNVSPVRAVRGGR